MDFILLLILSAILLICKAQVIPSQVIINGQCTGSIISERWIITSASCSLSNAPNSAVVSAAGLNLYGVDKVITHPNYVQPDYDIAMMKLNTNLVYNNAIQPITLDLNDAHDYGGLTVILNGSPFTNPTTFQIVDEAYCAGYSSNYNKLICAIPQAGQQFNCQVGAGSSVIWNNNLLIGLKSGAYQRGNQAHMFTRVSRHYAWISNQIALYNN